MLGSKIGRGQLGRDCVSISIGLITVAQHVDEEKPDANRCSRCDCQPRMADSAEGIGGSVLRSISLYSSARTNFSPGCET